MAKYARVSEIYDLVCRGILEPNGPKLGLISEAEILKFINMTVSDFLQVGAFVRNIEIQPILAHQGQYDEPDTILFTETCYVKQRRIEDQSTFDLAQADSFFEVVPPGIPTRYRQDQQMPKKLTLNPAPSWDGPQVVPIQGQLFFGTISEVEAGVSVEITASEPFYGVLSEYESSTYVDCGANFTGTISSMATSDLNLMLVGPSQPSTNYYGMNDILEQVPRSFLYYIRFGVLAKIFTNSSELKDLRRAKYCQERFDIGKQLAAALNLNWIYGQLAK